MTFTSLLINNLMKNTLFLFMDWFEEGNESSSSLQPVIPLILYTYFQVLSRSNHHEIN